MGDIPDDPQYINDLVVLDSLVCQGSVTLPAGSAATSIQTPLVYSSASQDLDLVGRAGSLGTTGAIRLDGGTVKLYGGDPGPVAVVNSNRLSCTWLENDINGLQTAGQYIQYTPSDTNIFATSVTRLQAGGKFLRVKSDGVETSGNIFGDNSQDITVSKSGNVATGAGIQFKTSSVELFNGSGGVPSMTIDSIGRVIVPKIIQQQAGCAHVSCESTGVPFFGTGPGNLTFVLLKASQSGLNSSASAFTPSDMQIDLLDVAGEDWILGWTPQRDGVYRIRAQMQNTGAAGNFFYLVANGSARSISNTGTSVQCLEWVGYIAGFTPIRFLSASVADYIVNGAFFTVDRLSGSVEWSTDGTSRPNI